MTRRILIIDDSILMRELARAVLGASGWTIDLAASGEEGTERAAAEVPDAILLDVEMDGIDGRETLRRLRAHERTRDVPVAFLTAHDRNEDLRELEALGAVAVIIKPVAPATFASRVAAAFGWVL